MLLRDLRCSPRKLQFKTCNLVTELDVFGLELPHLQCLLKYIGLNVSINRILGRLFRLLSLLDML